VKAPETIGICGAGQMGAAAAVSFKRAGYRTLLCERDRERSAAAERRIAELDTWLDRHTPDVAAKPGSIVHTDDLGRIDQEADLVMDAITEDMAKKAELFRGLPGARQRALFITTTSGLSITELGRRGGIGERLVGTHFWNPPHLMPLVEVVRGEDTVDGVVTAVEAVVRAIGKVPVRVNRDVPGFIGNRLLHAMWREAINLVERGIASPADVDRVARLTFGLRLAAVGPLENMDLVGLDLIETIHDYLLADLSPADRPLAALSERVAAGQLGMKSGAGFYDWSRRDAAELIDRRDRQILHQLAFLKELGAL
jgi:3-hydroxybutyryl-CoA dehydrogenase